MAQGISRLDIWRQWADVTMEEVAAKCGVTRQAVGTWCSGRTPPSTKHIEKFCDLIGITQSRYWGDLPKRKAAS